MKKWKQILRTVFVLDLTDGRLNLFELFPWLKRFFYNRTYFAWIRTFGDIVFLGLILLGLFGPQDPRRNVMLFLAWGVWWTSVVLSWFFVGRMWCAFCPFPGLARLLQNLGLSRLKNPPRWMTCKGLHLATAGFFFIIWAETVTDMKHSPLLTALLLLSIVAGATLLGVLYRGYTWCRYLCPLGKIIGSAATMALTEFRSDYEKCRDCRTFSCRRGREGLRPCPVFLGAYHAKNNLVCLVCGHCLVLCERDSPALYLRHPLREQIINKGRYITCGYVIPLLMGSQVARFVYEGPHFSFFKNLLGFGNALTFTFLFAVATLFFIELIKAGSVLFVYYEDELFGRFSPMIPVVMPLAFTGELVYRLRYFLREAGDFLPTLGRQIHLTFLENYRFTVDPFWIKLISFFLIFLGLAGGFYIAHYFYRREFEGLVPLKNYLLINLLFITCGLLYLLLQ
ncbi:4Fe-4S binding protein [Thermosulfurimonas sp. F29]|uniref:4Fe-4S binding protein n=1 Tax=Thermosulfurimonas sp. F29 TaxID=2867247 RepID=UPI001C840935|nr:4Fe-4S binding protein [Thermosulfurimonas sp. F29]MBX6422646.1 4Fe-4S binding protein [Thermosulfurimonas sp. F29]